jgi:hypothetical protein
MFIGLFSNASSVSVPSGTDLVVTSGYGALGEGAAAYVYDPGVNATYVGNNPRTSFISSNGRGFRLDGQQRLTIQMFGGRADGSYNNLGELGTVGATDNSTALGAAIAFLQANEIYIGSDLFYRGGAHIHFPGADGIYDFQSTVTVRSTVRLTGDSAGQQASAPSTVLRFPPDVHGFLVENYNTGSSGGVTPSAYGGGGTTFERLHILARAPGTGTAHGIWARSRILVQDCFVGRFSGNGIHIRASATASDLQKGNANSFRILGCVVLGNENGIFIDGADTNAGFIGYCDATQNRGYGIWDSSFLGNTIIGCHAEGNGSYGSGGSLATGIVSHGGSHYSVMPGQAGSASTTTPGTNPAIWNYVGPGGVSNEVPAWTTGMALRDGGAYRSDDTAARNIFIGCYSEGSQPPSYLLSSAIVLGGLHGAGIIGNVADLQGTPYGFGNARGNLVAQATDATGIQVAAIGGDGGSGDLLTFYHNAKFPLGYRFNSGASGGYFEKEVVFRYGFSSSIDPVFQVTGPNTTKEFGTGAPVPHLFCVPRMAFGFDGRIQTSGSAAPTSGAHAQGEIVWNTAPTAGGKVGWVCTAAGTPGTWKAFGVIDA